MEVEKKITLSQETIREKAASFLESYNTDKSFNNKFTKNKGFCSGLSSLWLYTRWLQAQSQIQKQSPCYLYETNYQKPQDLRKLSSNDDYDWFKSTVALIAYWDKNKSLTSKEIIDFKRFIYLMEYFQNIRDYLFVAPSSLEKFLKVQNKAPRREYSVISLLTLEQLILLLKTEVFIQDNGLIYISTSNHATSLFKNKDTYYYFDPNSDIGEVQTISVDEVAKLIFYAHYVRIGDSAAGLFDYNKPSLLGFLVFTFDDSDGGIKNYPVQADVLNTILTQETIQKAINEFSESYIFVRSWCQC